MGRPSLPEKKVIQICEVYLSNPGCACSDIAYIVKDVCVMTVYKKLKAAGYKCYNPKGMQPITGWQKEKLGEAYKDLCSTKEAARRALTTKSTVLSYWNSKGWKTHYLPGWGSKLRLEEKSLEHKLRA